MCSSGDLHLPLITDTLSSKAVEKRLNYLWKSAQHYIFAKSYVIANQFTDSMIRVARDAKAVLPSNVLTSICECCNAFLIPSLTCDVCVKSISKTSNYNEKRYRKLQKEKKLLALVAGNRNEKKTVTRLRNVLCVTCHRCRYVRIEDGAAFPSLKSKIKAKISQAAGTSQLRSGPIQKDDPHRFPEEIKLKKRTASRQTDLPRKLLDNPRRKKKKKLTANEAAAKSELDAFLKTVHPSFGT